jgi:hypothetical protein
VPIERRKKSFEEVQTCMKKLLTLLFSAVLVFSLAMPVFAQDAPAGGEAPKAEKKKKMKKEKKEKKSKKEKKTDEAPK